MQPGVRGGKSAINNPQPGVSFSRFFPGEICEKSGTHRPAINKNAAKGRVETGRGKKCDDLTVSLERLMRRSSEIYMTIGDRVICG